MTTDYQLFCIDVAKIHGSKQIWSRQYRQKIEEGVEVLGLRRMKALAKSKEWEIKKHGPHFLFNGKFGGFIEQHIIVKREEDAEKESREQNAPIEQLNALTLELLAGKLIKEAQDE